MTLSLVQRSEAEYLYLSGVSASSIARQMGVSRPAIAALLKRRGVTLRSLAKLSDAQKSVVVELYARGESTAQIAERLSVTPVTILKVLHKRGVRVRGGRPGQRDDAFDLFTTEAAAYWAGFLFADGCVHKRNGYQPTVSVGLSERDHSHLVKLKTFLESSNVIYQSAGKYPSCHFSVTSSLLARRLMDAGRYSGPIDPVLAKSRDFWRGVVDGDGSIGKYIIKPHLAPKAQFRVFGEFRILVEFRDYLNSNAELGVNLSVRPHKSIYMIGTTGSSAVRIIAHLYEDAQVVLDRKEEMAANIISLARSASH
jgi:predicted HTH domain antitoxin